MEIMKNTNEEAPKKPTAIVVYPDSEEQRAEIVEAAKEMRPSMSTTKFLLFCAGEYISSMKRRK
jgi:hypothetical protein